MTEQQQYNNNDIAVQQSIGRIRRASTIGIVVWIIGYIIVSHCFISLKWDSTNQNPVISTSSVVLDTTNNDNNTIVEIQPLLYSKEEIHVLKQQLRTIIDTTYNDINNIQTLYNSLRIVMKEYTIVQSKFHTNIQMKHTSDDTKQTKQQQSQVVIPEQLKLKQLLTIGNIHNEVRSPTQFSKYISSAINEIQTNILFHTSSTSDSSSTNTTTSDDVSSTTSSIDWTHYTNLFRNNTILFPLKKLWFDNSHSTTSIENDSGSCSIPPGMLDGNKSTTTIKKKQKLKLASENDFGIISQELLDTIVLPLKSEIHSITKSISNFKKYASTSLQQQQQQDEANTTSTTQEHLQQIIPTLLQSFPKSISKIHTSLHTIIESSVHEIKDSITIDVDDDDVDDKNNKNTTITNNNFICLSNYDINFWIQDGLYGLYRGENDIRQRIIQSMIDDTVPDADTIILYADLSSISVSSLDNDYNISDFVNKNIIQYNILQEIKKYNNRPKTIRQLLDIPAFYYTVSYLDPLIDTISGHNDIIDDVLEKIVWSQIPVSDSTETNTNTKNEIRILPVISTNNINNNESPNIIAQTAILSLYNTIGNIPIPNWFWDIVDP